MSSRRFVGIATLVTLDDGGRRGGLGLVHDGAILVDSSGTVQAAGPRAEVPRGETETDLGARVVMPGLVESHTHTVHAGDRVPDFIDRCRGISYEAIAGRGGGIQTTVRATREASEDELFASGFARLDAFLRQGATTVEIKSGYGLDTASELKMLRVIRRLSEAHPARVVATFLGAHTVPSAFGVVRERYLDEVVGDMIPEVGREGLAEFCDVFCERGAFTLEESRRVLAAGLEHGLLPKIHAEQLSAFGGARLAAEMGAVSADHLDHVSAEDARALASAGTVATLLPGATLYLGGRKYPPARQLFDAGATVALSTDFNPGSCPSTHLFLMGTLGCVQMGMSPTEALRALTVGGAAALRRADRLGRLAPGCAADFILLDVERPEEALYALGSSPVAATYVAGQEVFRRGG